MTTLDVYLEASEDPVGELSSAPDGNISFRYTVDSVPHPISASLPLRDTPYGDVESRGYFSNLLFENEMRDQVMQRHGIEERDIVGLLYHLGTDCPGSISCVPIGAAPGKRPGNLEVDYEAFDGSPIVPADHASNRFALDPLPVSPDSELGCIMKSLRDHRKLPEGNTKDPSPLAGVQGKIALTRLPDGRLGFPRPGSGAPTTHILKVPRAGAMSSVPREHLAMGLMACVQGHPVAGTRILGEGDIRGLLVERFDRRIDGIYVHRIHQEDFCQALGLGHQLKYERNGEPGRRFDARSVGRLLQLTAAPGTARQAFFEITLTNMLLGNSDNHAKNHALLYREGKPGLAPAYDIDPVVLDDVNHEMSFRLGEARMADDVTRDDLRDFCRALGYRSLTSPLLKRIKELVIALTEASATLPRPSGKGLADVILQQAHHLSVNLDLGIGPFEFDAVPVNRPDD
ncbi:MAG: HipA domain-containing protein [Rhodobacteraceae bacterium]|nr:HipA domain-containing protein [Paracoccaceae bacterium]